MPREPRLLRRQLLTWLLVPLLALLLVDSFLGYGLALEFSRRPHDRSLVEIARELSLHLRRDAAGVSLAISDETRRILLEDPDDHIYHAAGAAGAAALVGDPIPPPGEASGETATFYDARVAGAPVRAVELRVPAQAGAPAATVRVAETLNRRNALMREILVAMVLPQAVLLLLAAVIVWAGVAHGLAPLERLRRAVSARSHREWSPVAADDVPGEVRPLLQAIDELVARLDQALTVQSRFIADAAHQLKTPITVLKANLEVALREPEPERARQALDAAHASLDRLSRVVSQLLSLARNEPEGRSGAALAPLDLNALVLEASSAWVPAAIKRRIDLGLEPAPGPVAIRGDAGRLRELFDNLLDNAVRYSAEGGRVTVRVVSDPPAVRVDDDGPRIPASERQRVFDRFHRLLGESRGGSGLGLAIAREIAAFHGATIALEDDADGVGNRFSVTFPPPPSEES
jgi:two-component system sensor histidine kinase TctE